MGRIRGKMGPNTRVPSMSLLWLSCPQSGDTAAVLLLLLAMLDCSYLVQWKVSMAGAWN